MLNRPLDVVLIETDASAAYQDLAKVFSAVETPTWSLLLAQSCRSRGLGVAILDANAERLGIEETVSRIEALQPNLACFVVYGQNPNSGTTNMAGALAVCQALKKRNPTQRTAFVGSHTSALPLDVLAEPSVDFVFSNEGVYALWSLLEALRDFAQPHFGKIRGIGWKNEGSPQLNEPERIVPQSRMAEDLPGYAWDLLPFRERPLDLYRAHFWHARFNHSLRTPFAAIYTSLGCRFACNFCMINIVNRSDHREDAASSNYKGMRYWPPDLILGEIRKLAAMGVESLRISDEMFFLDKRYYEPLLRGVIAEKIPLRTWTYSRVDTVRPEYLDLFREAGVEWLALGIEAGNQTIRREASKGTFKEVDIREVVSETRASGINVIANYIFGLPEDTLTTMQQTLDLALELNTEMANMYPCMALPGSPLHRQARREGWQLPSSFSGYGFLSYDSQPLPTRHLSAAEVLRFRDDAWRTYFTSPAFLDLVEKRFGSQERANITEMASVRLRRKLLEPVAAQ